MENNLIKTNYNNEEVVFKVENGVSYVRVDEVAKFCGWSRIAESGNETIRWERVNKFLEELNIPTCGHGDFNYGRIIFDEIEESIKINKITYDLYSENDTEE